MTEVVLEYIKLTKHLADKLGITPLEFSDRVGDMLEEWEEDKQEFDRECEQFDQVMVALRHGSGRTNLLGPQGIPVSER